MIFPREYILILKHFAKSTIFQREFCKFTQINANKSRILVLKFSTVIERSDHNILLSGLRFGGENVIVYINGLCGKLKKISFLYPPRTVFVGGYTVFTSVRPNERTKVCP